MKEAGITALIIAHRASILGGVDKLLVLRDGTVEKFGPARELMQPMAARPTLARGAA
jgi:ABC-type protease/lipase transport system fused ATPase/permease subunit